MDEIDYCTLPTAQQPLRLAEFRDLFSTSVRGTERPDPTTVRLRLDPAAAAKTADLMVRENECCSFFTFALTVADGDVSLAITVPPNRVDVLEGLVCQA